jgi:hypothetical protein
MMGAGSHGGFGNTAGSSSQNAGKIFTRVQYEGSVTVGGVARDVSRRVYQRNDIDFEYYHPKSKMTNLQRMQAGKAPIGNDGKPVQLHHVLQKETGPMAEVREVTHREYKRTLHGLVGKGGSFRNDPVLLKQYNNFRAAYWKWRAKQYTERSKR